MHAETQAGWSQCMHCTFTVYGRSGFFGLSYRFTTVSAVSSGRRIWSKGVRSS